MHITAVVEPAVPAGCLQQGVPFAPDPWESIEDFVRTIRLADVFDIVDMIFEYLLLTAAEPEAATLTETQRLRLDALQRLLASPSFEVREWARLEVAGPIEFDLPPGRVAVGHVVDIGAGGMGISTWKPLAPGAGTALRFADRATGSTYEFPAVVVWSRAGDNPAMGVQFCGRPTRVRDERISDSGRLRMGLQVAGPDHHTPGIEYADTGLIAPDSIEH